jgi:hypothetical protein
VQCLCFTELPHIASLCLTAVLPVSFVFNKALFSSVVSEQNSVRLNVLFLLVSFSISRNEIAYGQYYAPYVIIVLSVTHKKLRKALFKRNYVSI